MSGNITKHIIIVGRVQGVGYRAWAMQTARELGLTGWVRNRKNGDVEALAHGPADAVENFIAACKRGPTFARVDDLRSETVPAPDNAPEGFQLLPTV